MEQEALYQKWERQDRDEAAARDALRTALDDDPGPWRYRDLEDKARQIRAVGLAATRDALWSLIDSDEAVMASDGIRRGDLASTNGAS